MIETNLRIVQPGADLRAWVKRARLSSQNITPDLAQKACNAIRNELGLAATPDPESREHLWVATRQPIKAMHSEGDEWVLEIADDGQPPQQFRLDDPSKAKLVVDLLERALLIRISGLNDLWRMESPRIWYEATPFREHDGIAAFRRYEIGAIEIEGVGVGLAIDVGVAFFTIDALAFYFDQTLSPDERRQRESRFKRLSQRQKKQKGTLVYDNGRTRTKCYFDSAPPGLTCGTTGPIRIKGVDYPSLLAYYQATNPSLPVAAATPAVRVSFKNLPYAAPVAADRVRLRVMNETLPDELSDLDKIVPRERRRLLEKFWRRLGPNPLGHTALSLADGFWQPGPDHVVQFTMPVLTFGKNKTLPVPQAPTADDYREHFRRRLDYLKESGCYYVPPNIARILYIAHPKQMRQKAVEYLGADIVKMIRQLTNVPVEVKLVPYTSINEAVEQLRDYAQTGMTLFVLNDEPDAYYEAEYQLAGWRIKRITEDTLRQEHGQLIHGAWDRRTQAYTKEAGRKQWRSFIKLNAFDVIQHLDVIPYRIDQAGPYKAQIIVDVGHDRRHFAVSLVIARNNGMSPGFWIASHAQHKVDYKQEAINPAFLADEIVALFRGLPRRFDSIQSLLIIRDGRLVGQEPQGLENALARLKGANFLAADAHVDWVDAHKDTLKAIRVWEVNEGGNIHNPLIGLGVKLNAKAIVLVTTGRPTLSQGTAHPILIASNGHCSDLVGAAHANFAGAQLNWSSPGVAQRLHIGMKRTDDDLKTRAAQEVRRLR